MGIKILVWSQSLLWQHRFPFQRMRVRNSYFNLIARRMCTTFVIFLLVYYFDRFAVVFYNTWVSGGFSSVRPQCRSWGLGQAQLTRNVMQWIRGPPPCIQRDHDWCETSVTRVYHVYRGICYPARHSVITKS